MYSICSQNSISKRPKIPQKIMESKFPGTCNIYGDYRTYGLTDGRSSVAKCIKTWTISQWEYRRYFETSYVMQFINIKYCIIISRMACGEYWRSYMYPLKLGENPRLLSTLYLMHNICLCQFCLLIFQWNAISYQMHKM